jgi:glucose/arabinose dehydrogenase
VALDPDFATNRWVYFAYTVDPNEDGIDVETETFARLTRYQVSTTDPNVIDLTTRQVLIGTTWSEGIPSLATTHTIGTIRFGRDKTLLLSTGDGSTHTATDSGGLDAAGFGPGKLDPAEDIGAFRAQTLNSLAGKILRVDKETGYGLDTNPYWDGDPISDRSRVWIYGVRNSYRFCVRPGTGSTDPADADPGTLYLGEVGWSAFEELNIVQGVQRGANLGWPHREGVLQQNSYRLVQNTVAGNTNVLPNAAPSAENPTPKTHPILWWEHGPPAPISNPVGWFGFASIGGAFYMGGSYPAAYHGRYFHADFSGWMRVITVDASDQVTATADFMTGGERPVDVEVDPATGDLYYISIQTHEVRRIRYEDMTPPAAPVLLATDPVSPGASLAPEVVGTAEPDATVRLYAGNDCSGAPIATGLADGAGDFRIPIAVAAGSTTELHATATDGAGNVSVCSVGLEYTQFGPGVRLALNSVDLLPPCTSGSDEFDVDITLAEVVPEPLAMQGMRLDFAFDPAELAAVSLTVPSGSVWGAASEYLSFPTLASGGAAFQITSLRLGGVSATSGALVCRLRLSRQPGAVGSFPYEIAAALVRDPVNAPLLADLAAASGAALRRLGDLTDDVAVGNSLDCGPPGFGPGDGDVDVFDLAVFSNHYGTDAPAPEYCCRADLGPTDTGLPGGAPALDGQIDGDDLSIFEAAFDLSRQGVYAIRIWDGETVAEAPRDEAPPIRSLLRGSGREDIRPRCVSSGGAVLISGRTAGDDHLLAGLFRWQPGQ